jgi:hypothetical protein
VTVTNQNKFFKLKKKVNNILKTLTLSINLSLVKHLGKIIKILIIIKERIVLLQINQVIIRMNIYKKIKIKLKILIHYR